MDHWLIYNIQYFQVTKKPAKSDKRLVLGSKLSSNRTSLSTATNGKKALSIQTKPVGNALDATAPAVRRGKEREKPKKKRPSKMRKIISAERAAKRMSQLSISPERSSLLEDFETETEPVRESEDAKSLEKSTVEIEATPILEVRLVVRTDCYQ